MYGVFFFIFSGGAIMFLVYEHVFEWLQYTF